MNKYKIFLIFIVLLGFLSSSSFAIDKFSMKRKDVFKTLNKSHFTLGLSVSRTDSASKYESKYFWGLNSDFIKVLSNNRIHRLKFKFNTSFDAFLKKTRELLPDTSIEFTSYNKSAIYSNNYSNLFIGYSPTIIFKNYSELSLYAAPGISMLIDSKQEYISKDNTEWEKDSSGSYSNLFWYPAYNISLSYLLPVINKRFFIEKDINYQIEFGVFFIKKDKWKSFKEIILKLYF